MSKSNKAQVTPFHDLYLPNHPVLRVIEAHLEEMGLEPKEIRKDDGACVIFHFRTTENISVVIRLYRYAGDLTYYLHLECAFALSLTKHENDLLAISKVLMAMNGELPCAVRLGQNEDFLVTQGWFHLAKMDNAKWLPTEESFWWLPETICRLIAVAVEAQNRIKDLPGYCSLPAPQKVSTAAN